MFDRVDENGSIFCIKIQMYCIFVFILFLFNTHTHTRTKDLLKNAGCWNQLTSIVRKEFYGRPWEATIIIYICYQNIFFSETQTGFEQATFMCTTLLLLQYYLQCIWEQVVSFLSIGAHVHVRFLHACGMGCDGTTCEEND